MSSSSSPKVVLITGTATGVGFYTALAFAKVPDKRYKVYATMRNLEERKGELEEAAGALLGDTLFIRELDLIDEGSRAKCVEGILDENKRIDILINNAVVVHPGLFDTIDLVEEGVRDFQVNYFGPLRLMQMVLPGMRERRSGRIINLGSTSSVLPWPFLDLYGHSKRALEAATESVGYTTRPFNVWVSNLQMGTVLTQRVTGVVDMLKNLGLSVLPVPEAIKDETLKKMFARHMEMMSAFAAESSQTPDEITDLILKIAEAEKPLLIYQSSDLARRLAEKVYVDVTGESRLTLYEKGTWEMMKNH